jgi:glycine hydroxymethyltransferase
MKENEMVEVAELIKRIVIDKQDPKKVNADVVEFRKDFQNVHYCFESAKKAYEYIKVR